MAISTSFVNYLLTLTCLIGLGLSIYAYVVELQLEADPNYKPACDISETMSCSKAFTSEYGKGLGIFGRGSPFYKPNSLVGIFFYSLLATLAQVNFKFTVFISMVSIFFSNVASLYFAYILYFKIQYLCVICVSIYVVNFINFILIQMKMWSIYEPQEDLRRVQPTHKKKVKYQ